MQSIKKFRLVFILMLLFQLVMLPMHSIAAQNDTDTPTWVQPVHYLALGDSLAYGIDPNGSPGKGYPDFLSLMLDEQNVLADSNKGFSFPGYTATNIVNDLNQNVVKPIVGIGQTEAEGALHDAIQDANFITISAGANDVLHYLTIDPETGIPDIDLLGLQQALKQIGTDYQIILNEIYKLNPDVQIYIMGYYNPFPHMDDKYTTQINLLLSQLNNSIQAGMQNTNAIFVPTKDVIATDFANYLPNPENIHLSEAGYKVVAEQFNNVLQDNQPWFARDIFTAILKDETTVTLNWKPAESNTSVDHYLIYNGVENIAKVDGDVYTFDVDNLAEDENYTFTIIAVDEDGNESIMNPNTNITTEKIPALFSDIENHWAESFIERATAEQIMNGYVDGTFKPENSLTRTQAASIIVRALGLKANTAAPFDDISGYAPETQAEIAAAYQYQIVKGFEGHFNPGAPVTRSQLALMVKRSYELITEEPYVVDEFAPFPDIGHLNIEDQTAITMLHNFELISGSDGKYLPGNSTKRSHAAKIFVSFLAHMQEADTLLQPVE